MKSLEYIFRGRPPIIVFDKYRIGLGSCEYIFRGQPPKIVLQQATSSGEITTINNYAVALLF